MGSRQLGNKSAVPVYRLFRKDWRCDLVGGCVSLAVDFEGLKAHARPVSLCCLLPLVSSQLPYLIARLPAMGVIGSSSETVSKPTTKNCLLKVWCFIAIENKDSMFEVLEVLVILVKK